MILSVKLLCPHVTSRQQPTAVDHDDANRNGRTVRRLNDGREFEIVKIFYDPSRPEKNLATLGWHGQVHATGNFFYYGSFRRED